MDEITIDLAPGSALYELFVGRMKAEILAELERVIRAELGTAATATDLENTDDFI
jgi:hypothetical protein